MAPRAHYGVGDSDHSRDDLRCHLHVGHRLAAGLCGDAHHRVGSAGGCSCCSRRRHQARSCGGVAAPHRSLARTDQAGDGHLLRDTDERYCLSSVSHAHREYRRVPQEPPDRHDDGAALRAGRCDDVRSIARLLHSAPAALQRDLHRREAPPRFLWLLQPAGSARD